MEHGQPYSQPYSQNQFQRSNLFKNTPSALLVRNTPASLRRMVSDRQLMSTQKPRLTPGVNFPSLGKDR